MNRAARHPQVNERTMHYQINEGSFTVPEQAQDRSVNMLLLNFGPGGMTLVVTRDELPEGEGLDAFLSRQLRTLGSQVKNFKQQERTELSVGSAHLPALQVAISFKAKQCQCSSTDDGIGSDGQSRAGLDRHLRFAVDDGTGRRRAEHARQLCTGRRGCRRPCRANRSRSFFRSRLTPCAQPPPD